MTVAGPRNTSPNLMKKLFKPLWNRKEAAEYLNISLRKVDTMVARGELPVVRFGRSVRFVPDAVRAFVRRKAEQEQQ